MADSEFVRGKAITATASGGAGDYAFTVAQVAPDPSPGAVTVTTVDGANAAARFSDDVPGLDPAAADETYAVTLRVTDADDDAATCTVDVRVVPVFGIGTLRGVVPDDADGRTHVSPYGLGTPIFLSHPRHAAVRGVVTQRTLEENAASPFDFEGFFVQSLDADPAAIGGFDRGDRCSPTATHGPPTACGSPPRRSRPSAPTSPRPRRRPSSTSRSPATSSRCAAR